MSDPTPTMQTFTSFDRTDDGQYVVARPRNRNDEPVRLPARYADRKEDTEEEGHWEELVSELTHHQLGDALAIDDAGQGVISREKAVAAFVDADDDLAHDAHQAEAVIEYLASEDILEVTDDSVVVLKPFEEVYEDEQFAMLNNWAATLDTCIDRIDHARERVKSAQERLEDRQRDTTSTADTRAEVEEEQAEIRQEIQSLLKGRDPSELDDKEYEQFRQLRKRYHVRDSVGDVLEDDLTDGTNKTQRLGTLIQDFELLSKVMETKRDEFRELSLTESLFPESAVEQLDNFTGLVTALSDTLSPEEQMEGQSDEEFLDELFGEGERIEQAREDAQAVQDVELTGTGN